MSTFTLHIQYVNRPPETRTFSQFRLSIGRADGDLCLHDPKVSSQHGEIRFHEGVLQYMDLGSTNGTFTKEGNSVQNIELHPGMSLRLGNSILTVQDIYIPQTSQRGSTVFMDEAKAPESSATIFKPVDKPVDRPVDKPVEQPLPQPPVGSASGMQAEEPSAQPSPAPATVLRSQAPAEEGTMFLANPNHQARQVSPAEPIASEPVNPSRPMPSQPMFEEEEATLIFRPPAQNEQSPHSTYIPSSAGMKTVLRPQPAAGIHSQADMGGKTVLRPESAAGISPQATAYHSYEGGGVPSEQQSMEPEPIAHPQVSVQAPASTPTPTPTPGEQENPWAGLGSEFSVEKIKRTLVSAWEMYRPVLIPSTLIIAAVTATGALLSTLFSIIPVVGTILNIVISIVMAFASLYAMAAVHYFMICTHLGQPISWIDAWKQQLTDPVGIGLNFLVAGLIASIGFAFLIVPGILIGCFIAPIFYLEDKKFVEINLRNLELVKQEWLTIVVLFLIAGLGVGIVVGIPVGILTWLLGFLTDISSIVGFIVSLLINPLVSLMYAAVIALMAAISTKAYFALRQSYEGGDIATLAKEKLELTT